MKTATVSLGIPGIPLLVLAVLTTIALPAQEGGSRKDFTDIKLEELGIKPVEPKKDAETGFIVGGKNATELIKGLAEINGKPIADLEKAMRPGASSVAGFFLGTIRVGAMKHICLHQVLTKALNCHLNFYGVPNALR